MLRHDLISKMQCTGRSPRALLQAEHDDYSHLMKALSRTGSGEQGVADELLLLSCRKIGKK